MNNNPTNDLNPFVIPAEEWTALTEFWGKEVYFIPEKKTVAVADIGEEKTEAVSVKSDEKSEIIPEKSEKKWVGEGDFQAPICLVVQKLPADGQEKEKLQGLVSFISRQSSKSVFVLGLTESSCHSLDEVLKELPARLFIFSGLEYKEQPLMTAWTQANRQLIRMDAIAEFVSVPEKSRLAAQALKPLLSF